MESLPGSSNILHVSHETISSREDGDEHKQSVVIATGADKTINFLSTASTFDLIPAQAPSSDSPVLSTAVLEGRYLLTSSMSGKVVLSDLWTGQIIEERKDHVKYVVKVIYTVDENTIWIASAAWDAKVLLYRISRETCGTDKFVLGDPVASISLNSNPEAILFIQHPEIATPVLLISRRDSTLLYYYTITESTTDSQAISLDLLGKQNLAPHSNAWVAFTPSAFAISPKDPLLLAVATSAVPHMKLILVRLLLPPPTPPTVQQVSNENLTQASQARAELAVADREAAAILIHCTTLAPQTNYSTPQLAWRSSGTGVWVNGDDGVVRGLEASTGKIVATLKGGHEPGTKIRCLWSGFVETEGREEEWVVSGGFDKRLIVWRPQD